MVFAILQMTFVSLVTISAEFVTIPASAETTFGGSCRKARASAPSDTSIRVVRYEPVRVVTALAVMHFTLLGIMAGMVGALSGMVSALAGRIGALSRKFCGMVGAGCVVVRTIGALVVRVSALVVRVGALAVMVGAQAGAISAFSVLV